MSYSPPSFSFVAHANGNLELSGSGSGVTGVSRYLVNDEPVAEAFGRWISPELADLLDVSVAVYLADRLARRSAVGNPFEHHWQRVMKVNIPVRDPALWRTPSVVEALRSALTFLTEDDWSFEFTLRAVGRGRVSENVQYLFSEELATPVRVSLFSGGLDSLAGLVADLESDSAGSIVVVSANTTPRILPVQRWLIQQLRARTGKKVLWAVGQFGLRQRKRKQYEGEERTQRTRGFVFAALGAVAAHLANADSLRLYENGIGAINLPYTDWQIGAQSTRAMHPTAITLLEDLIRLVTGRELRLELTNLFRTKGELCQVLARSPLAELATATISCDGFPQRLAGPKQCGICTSCLLRRQALLSAGIRDDRRDDFGYRFDIFRTFRTLSSEKRLAAQAMIDQAERISFAVKGATPWQRLLHEFPQLLELPEDLLNTRRDELVEMYSRYVIEWERFSHGIVRARRSA